MKLFVVLFLALFSGSSFSYAADFDETDPSTWNESHKIAARFAYCHEVIIEICPFNVKKNAFGNVFAKPKHPCPFFTDKLNLAEKIFNEGTPKRQRHENDKLARTLRIDIQRAKVMKQLEIPLSAYDNCQNDVEEFLADKYKPMFDLKSFND